MSPGREIPLYREPLPADEVREENVIGGERVYPPSTHYSQQHELEHETYHYLGWSHTRIERTVERLLSSREPDPTSTSAAREIVAAFGLTGPPQQFWDTHLGQRCAENGIRPRV